MRGKKTEKQLRKEVLDAVENYYKAVYKPGGQFHPGDRISYGGRVFDGKELANLAESALDFWLTAGKYADEFEDRFADFLGIKHCLLVNSGSSANLIAFMALTAGELGERRVKRGDEVITVAAGFPTTVAPIIQYGAVPVFADVKIPSYNIDCSLLKKALSKKTKAVMLAHTLGNPFDLKAVRTFCDKHGLWLIEDNCDALGSKYLYNGKWHYTGTIGDIGTSSFYPPHHMTMGEGGAVYTNNALLKRLAQSFRDWGRDCWCRSGMDDTCGKRFTRKFGGLPPGYDHKYVYSHFGYNLKATEMQAAIGLAQLEKLPEFVQARKRNWQYLRKALDIFSDELILPETAEDSDPSWFGFLLTVRENAGFMREDLVRYLESGKIQTRMLFAGNLMKHPCFDEMRRSGKGFRVVTAGRLIRPASPLPVTDRIMNDTFWIGVYPGMTKEMLGYIVDTFSRFMTRNK